MTDLVDNLHRYLRALETGDPDRQLCDPGNDVVIVRSAIDEIERLRAENEMLLEAISWALGESPKGLPDFPMIDGPPYYYWRSTLREITEQALQRAVSMSDD